MRRRAAPGKKGRNDGEELPARRVRVPEAVLAAESEAPAVVTGPGDRAGEGPQAVPARPVNGIQGSDGVDGRNEGRAAIKAINTLSSNKSSNSVEIIKDDKANISQYIGASLQETVIRAMQAEGDGLPYIIKRHIRLARGRRVPIEVRRKANEFLYQIGFRDFLPRQVDMVVNTQSIHTVPPHLARLLARVVPRDALPPIDEAVDVTPEDEESPEESGSATSVGGPDA